MEKETKIFIGYYICNIIRYYKCPVLRETWSKLGHRHEIFCKNNLEVSVLNPFMHNVLKRTNILLKSCCVNSAGFLKYVWPFYNIMHERVNRKNTTIKKYYYWLLNVNSRNSHGNCHQTLAGVLLTNSLKALVKISNMIPFTLSLTVPRWAGDNTDLPLESNSSTPVRGNIAFTRTFLMNIQ